MPVQDLLHAFNRYVFNDLPTHLLCINDMQLLSRHEIKELFIREMEVITEADIIREGGEIYPKTEWIMQQDITHVNGHDDDGNRTWEEQRQAQLKRVIQGRLRFAIFSHRWGSYEPSFRDMSSTLYGSKEWPSGPGYEKLLKFCERAKRYGCDFAWSDTCCIDKSSSAELEEAIRSMFRWYRNAEICIVHVAESLSIEDFEKEPWFTRGWTLQELLAPRKMRFYGKDWEGIVRYKSGSRDDKLDAELLKMVGRVTGIPISDIVSFRPGCERVHEKMLWASKRQTTRIEDIAYCLIGIFDISMPIAYGEGDWAFHRLMEVIVQRCGEPGCFAWVGTPSPYSLALPSSPDCYNALNFDISGRPSRRPGVTTSSPSSWPRTLDLKGDVAFTLTKFGLDVELLIATIEMTAPYRCENGDTLPRSSHGIQNITFNVKWDAEATLPGQIVSVRADMELLRRFPTWAIGIVNYERSDEGRGILRGQAEYLCLLLGKSPRSSKWTKLEAKNVIIYSCERSVRGSLQVVSLRHRRAEW